MIGSSPASRNAHQHGPDNDWTGANAMAVASKAGLAIAAILVQMS